MNTAADHYRREHDDPHAAGQPPLEVDRQRVIRSAAFRRLQHKTQVFGAHAADHFRSRLTHTLEVADLARVLAERLGLNAALAEAIALAHDVGHPPFGHAGERALADCMADAGGFEHNSHTLRVVEYLEHPYPEFRGLNLTRAVREGLAKHTTRYDRPGDHPLRDGTPPPLEGEVADLSDRLTYGLHDLQDGLYAGLLDPGDLERLLLWRESYRGPTPSGNNWRGHLRPAIDIMQRRLCEDVQHASHGRLHGAADGEARLILSAGLEEQLGAVENYLYEHLYRHPEIQAADTAGQDVIRTLFAAYLEDPRRLPERFARRTAAQDLRRVVADYIAGMTDRFCLEEHRRLGLPSV